MYRKSVIQAVGGYNNELRKGQDYDLWCRLIGRAIFSNLSEVYLDYYMPKRRPIKKIFYIFWQLIKASPTSLLPWRYLVKYLIPFLKRQ